MRLPLPGVGGRVRWGFLCFCGSIFLFVFCLWWLFFTSAGGGFVFRRLLDAYDPSFVYSLGRTTGSLFKRLTIYDIEGRGSAHLPQGAILKISRAGFYFISPSLKGLQAEVHNGRLLLPDGGFVMIDGTYRGGVLDASLFLRDAVAANILPETGREAFLKDFTARIRRIEMTAKGPLLQMRLKGTFYLSELSGENFILKDCPGAFQGLLDYGKNPRGVVTVFGGVFYLPRSAVVLKTGTIRFEGDFQTPRLKLRGAAFVENVKISVFVQGRVDKPQLKLFSQPSFPQEKLLLMLLTGKSWKGWDVSLGRGEISADMVKDIFDYVFLGSSAGRLMQQFGIRDIHPEFNRRSKGVVLQTGLPKNVGLTYGVKQEQRYPEGNTVLSQTVGVAYQVIDHMTIEGQKEVASTQKAVNATQLPSSNGTVYLKYKREF